MNHLCSHLILSAALSAAALAAQAQPTLSTAREAAPSDGWAGQEGATRGGADALPANIVTVSTPAQLRSALALGGNGSRIIQVAGVIDMSESRPFSRTADQAARGTVRLPSNTTLIGADANAGFVNAQLQVFNVSQVIVRNLHIVNPCDLGPQWDPADGAHGNWNSEFDGISIRGAHHVWIDHNSFTDAPVTDDLLAVENGKRKQCHDGALDITSGADLVTVSYNHFALHEKTMLIGASDKASGDAGRLRITLSALAPGCPTSDFLLCEDFEQHKAGNWRVVSGAAGSLAVHAESAANANKVMHIAGPGSLLAVLNKEMPLAAGDAFVEARIRPTLPSASGNRRLYVVGRYVDAQNWIGAGLDLIGASATVQVQLVRMQGGVLSRLKQVARARTSDERFSSVRLEMTATTLSAYLNGEKITTALLPAGDAARGRIGIYTNGGGFEVDDVRFGVPGVQPARLAPALAATSFTAQAGDPAHVLAISAIASDGVTRLPFTARSSNPAVVTVSAGEAGVTITPKAPGAASVVIASTTDPSVQTTIDATVTQAFTMPTQRPALTRAVSPATRGTAVPVDTLLRIVFDRPPKLGNAGSVRIFRKADDALVDILRVGEEISAVGVPAQSRARYVRHTPIKIAGNTATITPHSGTLAYGTEYYVAVGDGVFNETAIAGTRFRGIGKGSGWSFRTRPAAPKSATLTVDDDGPADFRTLQGALNHAMSKFDKAMPVTINIRNGNYEELLYIAGKDKLTIRGESRDGVVVHATNSEGINPGSGLGQGPGSPSFSGGRSLLLIEDADLVTLDTLTLRNDTLRSATRSGQAETLHFNTDTGRLVAKNANFFSEQDTIQVKGYAWFYRTLIAGNVDFIWGNNRVALFEESELRSVGDSGNPESGGYLVQARTVTAGDLGFVFLNSVLTHGPGPKANDVPPGATYLARSPGTANTWDNVSFINCKMDQHIAAAGWAGSGVNREPAPNPAVASATGGWREYGSTDLSGNRIELARRVGGYTLSAAEVQSQFSSRAAIFSAFDGGRGWNPGP